LMCGGVHLSADFSRSGSSQSSIPAARRRTIPRAKND
jgi:hypothetical protein